MKSLRRYLCVLLCSVLLLGAFSVSANATEVTKQHNVTVANRIFSDYSNALKGSVVLSPNDGEETKSSQVATLENYYITNYPNWYLETKYTVSFQDGSVLVPEGNSTTIKLNNAYYSYLVEWYTEGQQLSYLNSLDYVRACIIYADGTAQYIDNPSIESVTGTRNINLGVTFEPAKDVSSVEFIVRTNFPSYWTSTNGKVLITMYQGEWDGDNKYSFQVEQQSEEAGLLSGILGWIQNIFNSIGQGFTDMKNGIANIVNKIIELPSLLWEKIETGLKNLFVPDEEYMVSYKQKWEDALSSKLGAVWQVTDILLNSWDRITVADVQNTIEMPEVVIPLPEDNEFSFGGYEVRIVPEGFEFLADACKLATGILCSWLFIGGLRKRYDEVMGVEQ